MTADRQRSGSACLAWTRTLYVLVLYFIMAAWPEVSAQSKIKTAGGYDSGPLWKAWQTQYAYNQDTTTIVYDATMDVPTAYETFLGYGINLVTNGAVLSQAELDALGGFVQMPLAGAAIVLAYNLPLAADQPLVLSREIVANIWLGNITYWDDTAIVTTNSHLAPGTLPHELIQLSYFNNEAYGIGESFGTALSKFSSDFAAAWESAGHNFANMAPAAAGRATGFNTYSDQHAFVQTNMYAMTYINNAQATILGLPFAQMINKANQTVTATPDTISSAMYAYEAVVDQANNTIVDISDAPGNTSWPLSYLLFTSLTKANTPYDGCAPVTAIFALLTWAELNNQAAISMSDMGYAVLTPLLRSVLLNTFGSITCFGNAVYYQQVVQGIGPDLIMIPSWEGGYTAGSIYFKYYTSTQNESLSELGQDAVDFAMIQGDLSEDEQAQTPDAQILPLFSYGVAPAYNVPELIPVGQMNYTWEIMSGILLGNITMWNHEAIAAANPDMVGALPAERIRVIYLTEDAPSQYTLLWSTALAKAVPAFAAQVTPGLVVTLPDAVTKDNSTIALSSVDDVAETLGSVNYAFTVWNNLQLWPIPTIVYGPMLNSYNNSVNCTKPYMLNTINEFEAALSSDPGVFDLYLPKGDWSWPLLTWGVMVIHTRQVGGCDKYSNMLDWIWWTQSNEYADLLAVGNAAAVAGGAPVIQRKVLRVLANATCDGKPAFSLYGCIFNDTLCSNAGVCSSGVCACDPGYSGDQCQIRDSSSSSLSVGAILGIILGVFIPAICLLILIVVFSTMLVLWIQRRYRKSDDWEIDPNEIELGNVLGMGGFGEVYKAKWRGTEVAVKMMHSKELTKEMERNFKEEIRVMTALRHPNVVLFMAASTKPPKMCIVMEFMALGSLFDLLHNELLSVLPDKLRYKMAYQAAKGMHFLHSSGIVHRDLKSHNLLLDSKWNIKVSDFGLTKFRQDLKDRAKDQQAHGTIHWTAPEVLNEEPGLDYMLADVYSFGIILWELHTRAEPYAGMSPAAVAVAVLRDGARPELPADAKVEPMPAEYEELMKSCWHTDPMIRPSFLEIMTRFTQLGNEGSLTSSFKSTSTSSSDRHLDKPTTSMYTDSFKSSTSSSSASVASAASGAFEIGSAGAGATLEQRPPQGTVTIVFSDIVRAASLWEHAPSVMRDATVLHNELIRGLMVQHRGYEVVPQLKGSTINNRTNGMGSFCVAFQEPADALNWCIAVQKSLLTVEWPSELLNHPGAAEEFGDTNDRVIYRGLRVRMGVHLGQPQTARDRLTRRVEYYGPVINITGCLTALTHGGQVLLSRAVYEKIRDSTPKFKVHALGRFALPESPGGITLYELKIPGLEARFFGGIEEGAEDNNDIQTFVGDGLQYKEDNFLTSANLCRWVINFDDIQMGDQIGVGSYGMVFKGKWKGVEVAVKRFNKQKLDERTLLDFRAEMALLAELHHPNIVMFIGACVSVPNLCIVTEFLKRGSLKEILASNVKLPWRQKMSMLRDTALGVNYLHSLQPSIVHRDLKPSNLLVDENWNVKVADFGFARIKEENATMTRCGSPCWTAPEIIRGEKYSEKVDCYSFAIIMWEVITRRQPYAGHNFMSVSLEVLEGRRPQIPADVSVPMKKMIKRGWHNSPAKRPTMEELVEFLEGQLSESAEDQV